MRINYSVLHILYSLGIHSSDTPDRTCCARLSGNCVELLYGSLTGPFLHNPTILCLTLLTLFYPSVYPPSPWLSYTVRLLYPSVPSFTIAQLHCTSTLP